jgi:hypothetical protein
MVACALVSSPALASSGVGPWEEVRNDDGILVHRRAGEGFNLHEFRGRGVVNAPMTRVLGVLSDSERRVEWMDRCVESYLIEKLGDTGQIAYNRTKGTWPVSDRDVIVRGETKFDVGKREVRISFRNVSHGKAPSKSGIVRIGYLRGHWLVRPVAGGGTWVEYQAHADPSGSLPTFVVNMVSKQLPFKTIENLRKQVKRVQYPEIERKLNESPEFQAIMTGVAPKKEAKDGVGSGDQGKGS